MRYEVYDESNKLFRKSFGMKPPEIVAVAFYVAIAVFSLYYGTKVIIDEPQLMCGVAEISPDFNAADRMRCRQMRGHKL